jgi:hypothetical protein
MSSPPPELDRKQLAPRAGCWLFALPVLMGVAILLAYGYLYYAGLQGRPAQGDRPTLTFTGCDEARDVVARRVETMGLGDPVWNDTPEGFTLTATMPADPRVAKTIPDTLAAGGVFEVKDDQTGAIVVQNHVDGTSVSLGFLSSYPTTLIQLDEEGTKLLRDHMTGHPDGSVTFLVDGEVMAQRRNIPAEPRGRVEVEARDGTPQDQMEDAARWSVQVGNGVLPCPLTVTR